MFDCNETATTEIYTYRHTLSLHDDLPILATVEKIPVLNINELAQQLRMNHLTGERVSLTIVQKGNDAHQGVGYLSDGTMVVVEQASSDVGGQIEVEFTIGRAHV